ncbi:RraA family protein [Salinarimonas ramus]|uniref:Putative 4-hydroxy-4-methyl-2-oxoglutarate aldolase n=1 Tax=Salinarimonas ramus TaxID=690164 RepID=A0A917Q4G4_9HYPH|nr:RraA family protein [Salinarimonas ramus]GGK20423.1 diguanylate cyclase [Salinarimonas ramus]
MTEDRLTTDELARLRALSTSTLGDALDKLGLPGAVEGLTPIDREARIAGHAYTLMYMPVGTKGGNVGDYIDDIGAGDVVVIDNRGRTDCTVWGNILTEVARMRGVAGTVIDGVNRDLPESLALEYPIWSRRSHMRTGKDRVVLEATNVPVCLGTVRVEPGDVVCADGNGVVVLPLSRAREVLAVSEEIDAKEEAILRDVRAGKPLVEARRAHGYHALQTRTS